MAQDEEKYTQDKRILSIATPLGKDFLLIDKMTAAEAMSGLFNFEIDVRHQEGGPTGAPTEVTPQQVLGKSVTVTVTQQNGTVRHFNGIVNRFVQNNRQRRFTFYSMNVVPQHWLLTQVKQSRIFQHKSIPDILREVLADLPYKIELQGDFKPWNYVVQYRETDFDFISRLMEETGIFYFFEHNEDSHKMIISNQPGSHRDCPSKSSIKFSGERVADTNDNRVYSWLLDFKLQTGKVSFFDHKFEIPTNKLDASQQTQHTAGEAQKLEVYDYPGRYSQRFDGIDASGGERGDVQNIYADKTQKAKIAMDVLDSRFCVSKGESDCASFTPGHRFDLENHPIPAYSMKYVLTSVQHELHQSPGYDSDDLAEAPYTNDFECIPVGKGATTFRPLPTTPKPVVQGSQTAMVVGPAGEEIFTDKYGRVKVQFHWDRHGKQDSASSCWVRVAQSAAGKKWGGVFIPRIGMEVVVDFLEGDPDQPLIVGCVYNAETMPPYDLPAGKTVSVIKSNSSPGGGGFNEIRLEDSKGKEQIFIHGEYDMDVRVKHDKKEIIGNEKHTIVESNQYSEGKGDSHSKLTGDSNSKIGGSMSLNVTSDIDVKSGGKVAVEAANEIHLKAGMKVIIEAGTQISLKAGGSFVDIGPAGVAIKGTMVLLNSGGASGSGSGSSPDSPTAPKEADKADGGKSGGAKPDKPPPPPPSKYGGGAGGMPGAAQDGTPMV
ncbi:MAG: type VI secretion system Vgr family protein, partial [Pyrinomonadaceae bacterium]